MILQTNPALPEAIRKYGCGLMAVIWHAARLGACTISGIADVLNIYTAAIECGAMDANCYIYEWDAVFMCAGLSTKYTGRHELPSVHCRAEQIEILRYPAHFVAGNGSGATTYDPWGKSHAATLPLKSKRIFTLRG